MPLSGMKCMCKGGRYTKCFTENCAVSLLRRDFELWNQNLDVLVLQVATAINLIVLFVFIYCSVRTLADSLGVKVFRVKQKAKRS